MPHVSAALTRRCGHGRASTIEPLRSSACARRTSSGGSIPGVLTRRRPVSLLRDTPAGVTELMVHPGYVDDALRRVPTRLLDSRLEEVAMLCSTEVHALLVDERIQLVRTRSHA